MLLGQAEILKHLKHKRKYTDEWFTASRIRMELKENGNDCPGIHNDLMKLAQFKFIQWRGMGLWKHRKEFRGKKYG